MFEPERIYKRRELHDQYGGQRQGGISTPASHPFVFLFTGSTGEQHGYEDGWKGQEFFYYGEGQTGDMALIRGNKAISEAESRGK
jgi:5-methylcytosine-specific restriction protein A